MVGASGMWNAIVLFIGQVSNPPTVLGDTWPWERYGFRSRPSCRLSTSRRLSTPKDNP